MDLERIAAGLLIRRAIRIAGVQGRPRVRTAGKIEFVKDTGPIRRDIRVEKFNWTPESLRELAKILWASQRAHSYAMAAFRLFSKIPSSQISPDGLLGGRGYIQNIKDMRTSIAQAAEVLSSFTDTIDDEINAPHWQAADVGEDAAPIIDQTEEVAANPEQFVKEEFQEENPEENFDEPVENPNADDLNPKFQQDSTDNNDDDGWGSQGDEGEQGQSQMASYADTAKRDKKILERKKKAEKDQGSQLPGGTGEQHEGLSPVENIMHTTTPESGNLATGYSAAIHKLMRAYEARTASTRVADSSVDPQSLPGPRIDHIGPGEGGFNDDEQYASDDPTGEALDSGVNTSKQLPEGYDAMMDGTTGLGDPFTESAQSRDLASTAAKIAAAPQTYSWLPGADNSKNLDYYALGLTEADTEWLRAHSQPDPPPGHGPKREKPDTSGLWPTDF
jgi:hypothetical protein